MSKPRKTGLQDIRAIYENFPFPSSGESSLVKHWTELLASYFKHQHVQLRGTSFIDAGCGTGENTISFAKRFPEIDFTGVDLSSNSIKSAIAKLEADALSNLHFVQGDLHQWTPPQNCDVISCLGVLHHNPNPETLLPRILGWLKPGGIFFLDLYGYYGYLKLTQAMEILNLLEPDQAKLDARLDGMEWIAEQFLKVSVPDSKSDPAYIGLVDGIVTPFAHTYRVAEAKELLLKHNMTKVEWLDRPKVEKQLVTYRTFRGETLRYPLTEVVATRIAGFNIEERDRFLELLVSPFDIFFVGRKAS